MAKELPYFQFEPAEYLTKDISFCSLQAQGLFINICSYYWQRNCQLTKKQLLRRLNYETELNELINEGVVDLDGQNISIKFLDSQINKIVDKSTVNSANGSKGGAPKGNNNAKKTTEKQPKNNPNSTQKQGIREDKRIKEKMKEEDIKNIIAQVEPAKLSSFLSWLEYRKDLGKEIKVKSTLESLKNRFNKETADKCRAITNHSIENNYQGLFWDKVEVFKPAGQQPVNNPDNEKIITFHSNIDRSRKQLPESKFLDLKRRMAGGGYIYTIIKD